MTHKFNEPSIQVMILQSILRHSQQYKAWPKTIVLNPAHLPYANLFLACSDVSAVGSDEVAVDEVVTE